MLEGIREEIAYMNSSITPTLVQKFGAGTFRTGMVVRCAEMPSLINAPTSPAGAVRLEYKDCIRFSGRCAAIDKAKFLARYYATEEGRKYKAFLDSLEPLERERFNIF